jgi:hypothetical protein
MFSALLLMSMNPPAPVFPSLWDPGTNPPYEATFEKYGSRVSDIIFEVMPSLTGESDALAAGLIDLMDWPTPTAYIPDWILDTGVGADIWMGTVSGLWYYEIDMNCQNWPIGDGLGETLGPTQYPTPNGEGEWWINYTRQRARDCREFRRALNYLFNRPSLLSTMKGYGVILDTFIPPVIGGWEAFPNGTAFKDCDNPIPTYSYDPALANTTLWNAGFRDYDGDGDIDYSKNRTLAGKEDLPDLQLWIRSDDPFRSKLGQDLWDELLSIGIPVSGHIDTKENCFDHAWVKYDSHLYTGGWDIMNEPDYYYDAWHSSQDDYPRPSSNNYMRYHNKEFDYWGEKLKFAVTTDDAREALYHCEYIVANDTAGFPTHTDIGYQATRKQYGTFSGEEQYAGEEWLGLVNEVGVGLGYEWSTFNMHPGIFEKGGVIRHGMLNDVTSLNPVHADWYWDWLILDQIYSYLVLSNPFDLSDYMPWMCHNYTIGRWFNATSGTWGSKVNFDLIDNIYWHDTTIRFNATDVKTTFEIMKLAKSVLFYPYVEKLDHVDIHSEFNVTVYYSVESCWIESWMAAFPMLPDYIWGVGGYYDQIPDKTLYDAIWEATPEADGTLIGCASMKYHSRVESEYIRVTENPQCFRKLFWPDVLDPVTMTPGDRDEIVGLVDFLQACLPGYQFTDENPDGTWPDPLSVWGPYVDVNYDRTVDTEDLVDIGFHYVPGIPSWPPPYYKFY